MKLICGLGNPGKRYENNRHNLGFMVINSLSRLWKIDLSFNKFKACYGKGIFKNFSIILVKPMTYINSSGIVLNSLMNYFKIKISDVIIISDDLNINFSCIRIKMKGSAGGHNGLKSVIECLGNQNFIRVRLGIGYPDNLNDIMYYVLSNFNKQEKKELDFFIQKASEAINFLLTTSVNKAMNKYN